jgi:hypothetical protein
VVALDVIAQWDRTRKSKTIGKALADLNSAGLAGGRKHLKALSGELSAGHFADSARESIHAVECVVRVLEPHGDFRKALANPEARTDIHGGLKHGFTTIYGFTSDQ